MTAHVGPQPVAIDALSRAVWRVLLHTGPLDLTETIEALRDQGVAADDVDVEDALDCLMNADEVEPLVGLGYDVTLRSTLVHA